MSSRAKNILGGGGGGGRGDEAREGEIDLERDCVREEDALGDSGEGCCPAQLGILTISSVSNVRASIMCTSDVC